MNTPLTMGEKIEDLIKKKESTQAIEAKRMGVSPSLLSDVCNDKRDLRADSLKKLCDNFNVSSDWLLGLSNISKIDATAQSIGAYTGLSEYAIEKLHSFHVNDIFPGYQFIDFYSEFIESTEIFGILALYPGIILRIRESGLKGAESVFENEEDASNYYKFKMQEAIMRFLNEYFENKKLVTLK